MKIKRPEEGSFRTVKRFCILPRRFDGCLVWLNKVLVIQEYVCVIGFIYFWSDCRFADPKTGEYLEP